MIQLLKEISESTTALVGLSAFLATFIGSVMADEQDARLRQGAFGAIAGTSVGGLAAIMQKDPNLLLIGLFGSAVGAVLGWIVYLGLSLLATQKWARRVIEYHVGGLKGVREKLDLDNKNLLLSALNTWSQNFRGMVLRETSLIMQNTEKEAYDAWVEVTIRAWLTSLIDAFNLVLDAVAEKPEYRSRITLIVFGMNDGRIVGRHWITYAGHRQNHKKNDFGTDSYAYRVASGQENSPYFSTMEAASKHGEDRNNPSYSSFLVFQLNECAVLSMDWPSRIKEQDSYIDVANALIHMDVGPAIAKLLKRRVKPIAGEVGLGTLLTGPSNLATIGTKKEPEIRIEATQTETRGNRQQG